MNRFSLLVSLLASALCAVGVSAAPARVRVAASLPDLASIAASVGGDAVEVFSIARPGANPHFVEVLPSYMIRVAKAEVYLKAGLGLDPWADAIVDGSRNGALRVVDASAGVRVLEKPSGKVDASQGHVHPEGNPHYWLDPENGIRVAATVRDALKAADPARAARYDSGYAAFRAEAEARIRALRERMAPLRGAALVTYHSSWPYFADAFGLRIVGRVEPFPGIPPTARHLAELAETIRAEKAAILIQEPYYPGKDAEMLARKTGIRVFRFAPSCEGTEAGAYLRHFETIADALLKETAR